MAGQQADCQPLRTCTGKAGEITLNACQNNPPINNIVLEGAMVGGPNFEQFTLPTPSWDPGHCSCAPARPVHLSVTHHRLAFAGNASQCARMKMSAAGTACPSNPPQHSGRCSSQ